MNCKIYLGTRRLSQAWRIVTLAADLFSCEETQILSSDLSILEVHNCEQGVRADVLRRLELRDVPAVHMNGRDLRLIGVYSPDHSGSPYWHCIMECEQRHAEYLYGIAINTDGIDFLALSVDEIPDFNKDEITENNFPWTDWLLLRGAVRDASGRWVEKTGPRWLERNGS